MLNLLNKMPAYRARRWALIYFNVAVWVVVGGAIGLAALIG